MCCKGSKAYAIDAAITTGGNSTAQGPCVMIPLTEKRFFDWHPDEVSVTLREKSGSYGGGAKCLL